MPLYARLCSLSGDRLRDRDRERDQPSPKYGAMILTLTFSPMRHIPIVSYRLTPQSRGHRLQLRRWAYASDRFFAASTDDRPM